ncbi:alpha/beta hydrolase family protein [Phocicoccus pinnipedialis]|uniref:Prolyl tripeptidyl peptidase n=1 Tax=Phocicoccus pinnipedialis TaxID=110845 RepID=A0A6V7R3Q6_9BACL|nr:S9 family peptidase [Jeotgalicoccus pinnipedialis]MBP1940025.1 dipeptidyl aminopeptidase/acylaminoacyl peptidase [Jeotgalicoccus pinnipedialis]CAD2072027.1 Prolyl tripeptidyl peptidase precursor [Jeotgalicoccus pinnipedialis]
MNKKKTVQINDIFNIKSVSTPKVVPNSERVTYYVTSLDEDNNTYYTHLHQYSDKGNLKLTYSKERLSSIMHSPTGNMSVFIANGDNDKPQLFILREAGGEREQLTDEKYGVSNAMFCKGGSKVFYHVSVPVDEKDEHSKNKDNDEKFPEPVVVNRMKYKSDGLPGPFGSVEPAFRQIKMIKLDSREVTTVKSGEENFTLYETIRGGFVYATDKSENPDFNFSQKLYIHLNGEDTEIERSEGGIISVETNKDDTHLLITAMDRKYENATHPNIELYEISSGQRIDLTGKLDKPAGDAVVQDIQQSTEGSPAVWVNDTAFVFLLSDDGSVNLWKGNIDGEVKPLLEGRHYIYGMDANSDAVYMTISTPVSPSELYKFDLASETLEQLTEVNKDYVDETELVDPEDIVFESFDETEVHGWFMKPANYESGKVPMVVNIHGGPHAFYANTFFHEMQVLASQGYAVLFVNPRGSHSYSQEFVDAVRGDYGNGDYKDIMAAVDFILEKYDFIDGNNLGVTGGSYGGFMTNWIVGHTNRFKAAVTQRSISNWISFRGVSDIGYYFTDWQIMAGIDDLDTLWKHSPLKYVDDIETPLLILHSEYDFRCPIEQAEQLYTELKYRGKDTQFVRFPDADHNLSRTGAPNLRIARLEYMTNWFNQYLEQ